MELRVLRYFCAVADGRSITDAAKSLHVTQPTLSRQLAQLEDELGTPLFSRGRRGIELTERGVVLYRYARNIIDLADKAEEEVAAPARAVSGTVHIGAGETRAFSLVARACANVRTKFPNVTFDIHDGTSSDLWDNFVRGHYDVLLDCDSGLNTDFNQIALPIHDVWGVIVRRDDPIAILDVVCPHDLVGREVIVSGQGMRSAMGRWVDGAFDRMRIVSTYGLPLNSRLLVVEGVGVMLTYGGLVDEMGSEGLCFRPLSPRLEAHHKVLWRKTTPTKQAQAFLDELSGLCV